MSTHTFQLAGNAAEVYEAQKVPAIFGPLAELTVDRAHPHTDDRVLDIACGTGIILRVLAKRLPKIEQLVGVDLNAGMLEVARKLSAESGFEGDWRQGDVTALPFEPASFTLCFCQQGLQYFPDKPKALSEIHRVLEPGGRLLLSLWSEVSPLFAAMGDALEKHVSKEAARRAVAPFAFRDQQVVEELLEDAGLDLDDVRCVTIDRKMGPADESFPKEIAGSPIAEDVDGLDPKILEKIVTDMATNLAAYRQGNGFSIPQSSYLFSCTKTSKEIPGR